MEIRFSEKIDKILAVGVYMGIEMNNWALTKEQALDAFNAFERLNIAVLGGDVIEYDGDIYSYESSSWYSNRRADESYKDFVKRSIDESRKYVTSPLLQDFLFSIVPG